jgi:hypothetical protein
MGNQNGQKTTYSETTIIIFIISLMILITFVKKWLIAPENGSFFD